MRQEGKTYREIASELFKTDYYLKYKKLWENQEQLVDPTAESEGML